MNKFVLRQSLILLLAATVWGVAFVAQSVGMDYVGPFTFLASRSVIGALVLSPYVFMHRNKGTEGKIMSSDSETAMGGYERKSAGVAGRNPLLVGGVCCGTLLFIASILQQVGIMYTTVGKSGFITAMYIVGVPMLGIFMKKKVGVRIWLGVALAAAGLYFLCMTPGNIVLQKGDILTFFCAIVFSLHILVVDYFAPKIDGVKLSCIQFVTCAVLASVGMLLFEKPSFDAILAAWMPILYAGALSSGVGYTLQIIGQRGMNPAVASLIMSMESVISVIAGWLLLQQALSKRELFGCVLMFVAIVLVQLPEKKTVKILKIN